MLHSVGPALIVAAVVLGPGSILTSSKVGAGIGLAGFPVIVGATILMIAMVILAARLGAFYQKSLCEELADRLGRPVAVGIGLVLFTLVALFQSSNNIALIAGLEPMLESRADAPAAENSSGETSAETAQTKATGSESKAGPNTAGTEREPGLPFAGRVLVLLLANSLVIGCLYFMRNLYRSIETGMKILIGLMTLAFVVNFLVVFTQPRGFEPVKQAGETDWLSLLGMIGTTFSVGGAFYQAYLVREKGWGLKEVREGTLDSVISISLLGLITSIILLSSWRVFCGHPDAIKFSDVGDVARQLEPSFGFAALIIFCTGILAGGLSSFLVNALIGGTVMSDAIGAGHRLSDRGTLHLTSLALLVGMGVGVASLYQKESTVFLITIAQALTVLGIPALAAALIYLGTRPEAIEEKLVPPVVMWLAVIGFVVSCGLAILTAYKVIGKIMG